MKIKKLLSAAVGVAMSLVAMAADVSDLTFYKTSAEGDYVTLDRGLNVGTIEVLKCKKTASGKLVIPAVYEGKVVVRIWEDAFSECKNLTEVILPHSIKSIGKSAFAGCERLKTVRLSENLDSIGIEAFSSCIGLKEIVIPDSVQSVNGRAFYGCSALEKIHLGKGISEIGEDAFHGTKWESNQEGQFCIFGDWVLGAKKKQYEDKEDFYYPGEFPNELVINKGTYIADGAFSQLPENVKSVVIGDNIKKIGKYAFNKSELDNIRIGNKVEEIGHYAFRGCGASANVVMGKAVKKVGSGAFGNDNTADICIMGNWVVQRGTNMSENVVIPKGVVGIADNVFSSSRMTTVVLPDTVKYIGEEAFSRCQALTSITFGKNIESIGAGAFSYCQRLEKIDLPSKLKKVEEKTFAMCKSLESVTLGSGVTSLMDNAFVQCTNLTSVTLPASLKSIGDFAFRTCLSLRTIKFGTGLESIGYGAFESCTNLTEIALPANLKTIGGFAFGTCRNIQKIKVGTKLERIGINAFLRNKWVEENRRDGIVMLDRWLIDCNNDVASNVSLAGVTGFADYAFHDAGDILTIEAKDLKYLGNRSFSDCSNLTAVTFNNSKALSFVGNRAFENTALDRDVNGGMITNKYSLLGVQSNFVGSVKIPEGIKVMPNFALLYCPNVSEVEIPKSLTTLPTDAFSGSLGLERVVVKDTFKGAPKDMFRYCPFLNFHPDEASVVSCDKAVYTVMESAASVKITVKRTGKKGAIAVRYTTVMGSARPGEDYVPATGVLRWADGDTKAKTIEIKLLADEIAKYEANKTLAFILMPVPGEELGVGEYQPMFGANNTVGITIQETSKKQPGTVKVEGCEYLQENIDGVEFDSMWIKKAYTSSSKPEMSFHNYGESYVYRQKLCFTRSGGTDGTVIATITAKIVSGLPGDSVSFGTVGAGYNESSGRLFWGDGDSGMKECGLLVRLDSMNDGFNLRQPLKVQFTVTTAEVESSDVALVPGKKIGSATTITHTYYPENIVYEDLAKVHGNVGDVQVKPSKGQWALVGSHLLMKSLAPGKSANVALTVTGPGRMSLACDLNNTPGMSMTVDVSGDKQQTKTFTSTSTPNSDSGLFYVHLYLGAGKQTVTVTVKNNTKRVVDSYDTFLDGEGRGIGLCAVNDEEKIGNGNSFCQWQPFDAPKYLSPEDKAFVKPVPGFLRTSELAEVYYSEYDKDLLPTATIIYCSENKLDIGKTSAILKDPDDVSQFKPGKTYYWRADAVLSDKVWNDNEFTYAAKLIVPNKVIRSFTVVAADAPSPVLAGRDVNREEVTDGEPIWLYVGVQVDSSLNVCGNIFGGDEGNRVTYSVASGKLPDGVKLNTQTGVLSGIPTKSGTFKVTISAGIEKGIGKAGKPQIVPGETKAIVFDVRQPQFAGSSYSGLLRQNNSATVAMSDAPDKLAYVTFTAGKTGSLSAKALMGGKSYSFKTTGFTGTRIESSIGLDGAAVAYAKLASTTKIDGKILELEVRIPVWLMTSSESALVDDFIANGTASLSLRDANAITSATGEGVVQLCSGEIYLEAASLVAFDKIFANFYAPFEGYYTVALESWDDHSLVDKPTGAGYLTMTIGANGMLKAAGVLGDGTAMSLSANVAPQFVSEEYVTMFENLQFDAKDRILIPLYHAKGTTEFGGIIDVDADELYCASNGIELQWVNTDPKSTYDLNPNGFFNKVSVCGGYYNTKLNLAAYYRDNRFSAGGKFDSATTYLPGKMISSPDVGSISFTPDQKLKTDVSGFTLNLTPATGIFTGEFTLTTIQAEGGKTKNIATKAKAAGVMLPSEGRAADTPGMGYFTIPVQRSDKSKWTGSWLFTIDGKDISAENEALYNSEGLFN